MNGTRFQLHAVLSDFDQFMRELEWQNWVAREKVKGVRICVEV